MSRHPVPDMAAPGDTFCPASRRPAPWFMTPGRVAMLLGQMLALGMMTRRSPTPVRARPRRSLIVIAIVILAVLGLGFAIIPSAMAPQPPLNCQFGEIILNGVHQCAPPR
jgi:peptidoglycan/LPS O-acetylase OafA/YrhL